MSGAEVGTEPYSRLVKLKLLSDVHVLDDAQGESGHDSCTAGIRRRALRVTVHQGGL